MNPLAWLISLILPACGFPAAEGLPTPPLMDVVHIVRPATPNTALAAPAGFAPSPDIVTPPITSRPTVVRPGACGGGRAAAGLHQAALYPEQLQVHYVARSAVFDSDLIMVQVRAGSRTAVT